VIRRILTNLSIENNHPVEERLLGCVDGELSTRQSNRVRRHLESCWPCRATLDSMEETISLFVEFQNQILAPATPPPPGNWNGFSDRLKQVNNAPPVQPKSYWKTITSLWGDLFAPLRLSNWSPTAIQAFSGSVAMLLITALLWQLVSVRSVSANELLDKAMAEQMAKINSVSEAVVYQKIRVGRSNAESFEWEVWMDTTGGRYRQTLGGGPQNSLADILSQNHMNPLEPLSPASFRGWRDSLVQREEEVSDARSENGQSLLALRTINKAAQNIGEITQGILKVRESDWHPVYEELHVKTSAGEETYELSEVQFQVVSRSTLQPDFFGEDIKPQIAETKGPNASPSPAESPSSESDETVNANVSKLPAATATADDEVEVLQLLNQAGADLGEQITVKRENGILYIRGIVETVPRKNEILGALTTVSNNPSVVIDIKTIAEAASSEKNKSKQVAKAEDVTPQSETTAAENELVQHFGNREAARQFASQTVNRSAAAVRHVYALKRLMGQLNPEELRQLSPDSRAKWLSLVRSHASAFQRENALLRGELQKVFGGSAAPGVSPVSGIADVPRAVNELLTFASANDRVIRSAMTVSARETQFSAIRSPGFWQSLASAEAIAAGLEKVK
jgi:hypothetical protein